MRELLHIPIIHTEADMGSLKESVRAKFSSQRDWSTHRQQIDGLWDEITQRIASINLDYKRVRVYQDGLPVCGHELDIVRDLASQGNKNHKLVMSLVEKGATLEGTEDANLLLEEYNYIKSISQNKTEAEAKRALEDYREKSRILLQKRDDFIAKRIDSTLKKGETGILIVGVMHEVEKRLPDDIQVERLVEWHFSAREVDVS
jgi:hypothetical protein